MHYSDLLNTRHPLQSNFQLFTFYNLFALQRFSRRLSSCQDNVCMAMKSDSTLYAVGCRSYTLLLDSRTLHTIKKIPARYSGCGLYIKIFILAIYFYIVFF